MDMQSLARSITGRAPGPIPDVATMGRIFSNPRMPLLLALSKGVVEPTYRAAFLSSAAGSGVLRWLSTRPCDVASLAEKLEVPHEDRSRLRDWLEVGVRLGDLRRREGCYTLRSLSAKALAKADNDALAAALEEVMRFHLPVLLNGPRMLREGRRFSLSDQDGAVIARASLVVRPLVEEAISSVLDRGTPLRLLEVGCGSGVYVKHAAELNPRLTALAVDLQAEVADEAAKNMVEWGLTDRVETRQADLRDLSLQPQFDLVTLHNNIYYFPESERVAVLRKARSLLTPGGRLLLTSACRGGNIGMEVLNLWFRHADFGGALPREDELVAQLERAGFSDVRTNRVVPGEQFRAFTASNTHPTQV
ncbi:SAM-dependent methyltransferase [Streptomyces oceani]|uniref:SAM-dependent methyltransferase n=1 Tax=Streptomyces oceani TaxID=1075402 RepID=A0A1E7KEV2_9ACTN|nr:class I SAM-dependent methyltransferase [Streptomyces oceani]OEV02443.1 SAM-dependent methyltransferase [Streptomyces oceani]